MLARVLSLDTPWYSLSWCTHEYHEIVKNICQLTLLKLPEASEAEKSEPLLKAVEGKNRVCPSHERHGALPAGSAPIPPKKKNIYTWYTSCRSNPNHQRLNDVLKCSVLISYYSAGISEYWAAYCSLCCVSWDLGQHIKLGPWTSRDLSGLHRTRAVVGFKQTKTNVKLRGFRWFSMDA